MPDAPYHSRYLKIEFIGNGSSFGHVPSAIAHQPTENGRAEPQSKDLNLTVCGGAYLIYSLLLT
jgi:hypothetical protein